MRRMSLAETQECCLAILKAFDAYCNAHGLRYWLLGGSALGAIRHGGMIPWDDDIDVGMPRPDYERFCASFPDGNGLQLLVLGKTAGYYNPFAKLCDTRTLFNEPTSANAPHGVFIDIFAIDYIIESDAVIKRALNRKRLYNHSFTVNLNAERFRDEGFLKKSARKAMHNRYAVHDALPLAAKITSSIASEVPTERMMNIWGAYEMREIMRAEWFGDGVRVPFEDAEYPIPACWDEYLTQLYGDYMTPPKEPPQYHGEAFWLDGIDEEPTKAFSPPVSEGPAAISVIVPVYNVEDTLERCMGSILAQSFRDLDIILIDDGSTDISGAMCDAYAEFDVRVRVFHTPNRGLSAARNLGIDHALKNGSPYIAFVDSDDYIAPQMFEKLIAAITASDADMAQCGKRNEGMRTVDEFAPSFAELDKGEAVRAHIGGKINADVWNKLYRSRIFEELRFPAGRAFEEISIMPRIVALCDKVVLIPYIGYHYVMHAGGISHSTSMSNLVDYWLAYKDRHDYLLDEVPELIDDTLRNGLVMGKAHAVSRMWRWAYANSAQERAQYKDVLDEMRVSARSDLDGVDMGNWPASLKLPIALARNGSEASLVAGYMVNQVFIRLFPQKSSSRK